MLHCSHLNGCRISCSDCSCLATSSSACPLKYRSPYCIVFLNLYSTIHSSTSRDENLKREKAEGRDRESNKQRGGREGRSLQDPMVAKDLVCGPNFCNVILSLR